ncbi:MAG: hypothetical protein HY063_03800 [Bacteroidetes bacterium]|nr:hypothetical protein [Bacteroidota bacterium]
MKKSDELFLLIKSLSRNEKGYFKKYAFAGNTEEEKNYFRLFDAVDAQNSYDEDAILHKFKGEPFAKQLHRVKNYLFHLILKSMRAYRSQHSVETIIQERLQDVHFLHLKGLYAQAQKVLKSTKELAYKHEKFSPLIEILNWERKIVSLEAYSLSHTSTQDEIIREKEEVISKQKNIHEFEKIFFSLDSIINARYVARSKNEAEEMKKIISHPLLKNEKNALSNKAKILFHYTLASYYFATGAWEKVFESTLARKKIIESVPEIIQENPEDYIIVLRHEAYLCLHKGEFSQFGRALKELRSVQATNSETKAAIFEHANLLELYFFIVSGQYQKSIELIEQIEKEMPQHQRLINPVSRLTFYYHYAYCYFAAKQYHTALKYINEVLNNKEVQLRQDIFGNARVMNLMIHYELGNDDLMESAIKSTVRFLDKKNKLYDFEKKILAFFKLLSARKPKGEELKNYFIKFHTELISLMDGVLKNNYGDAYQFIIWLESKINNLPLEEVLRKNISLKESAV